MASAPGSARPFRRAVRRIVARLLPRSLRPGFGGSARPGGGAVVGAGLTDGLRVRAPWSILRWYRAARTNPAVEPEVPGAVGAAAETHALDTWLDDPERREVLLRAIRRVEAEPSLLGASPHVIALATAP